MHATLTPVPRLLQVERVGGVTVARFTRANLLDEGAISVAGAEMRNLAGAGGRLVLDFARVERLGSLLVGKLIGLHKKLQAAGGRLAVCNLHPDLGRLFRTLALGQLFGIHAGEPEAVQSLQ